MLLSKIMSTSDLMIICWLACPAVFWIVFRRRLPVAKLVGFACIAGYFLLLAIVVVIDSELWHAMQAYDLDADGLVSGDERTSAAVAAEMEWSGDAGRQLAPLIGVFYVLVWFSLVFLIFWMAESIARLIQKTKNI